MVLIVPISLLNAYKQSMFSQFGKIIFVQHVLWLSVFVIKIPQNDGILTKDLRVVLPSGDRMPMVGFGTGQIYGTELVKNTLDDALASGYRLFDTAAMYENEEEIGKALKELLPKHNLTRKDIFITSKLAPEAECFGDKAFSELEKSVRTINCSYLDLYLIHYPGVPSLINQKSYSNYSKIRDETWQQLVKGVKKGLARNIGVSNYNVRHLTELMKSDHGIKVAVNQVEWNPRFHEDDVMQFCRKNGILLQGYSPLGGTGNLGLLNNSDVKRIAEKLGKLPAQVLLRWALQQNISVISRSMSRKHMESNIDLNFDIPQADMAILNNFPRDTEHRWNQQDII